MTAALKNMRDFCETTSSKRIYASEYVNAGVPFYRSKEVIERQSGKLDVSTEIFITESRFEEIERKFGSPQKGDLLLTSVGTLGIPYVVAEGERFYFKDGNLTWFRNFRGLDSRYLYYWLLSPLGKSELKKATIGSSQAAYTINLLSNLVISPPDIDEQHRVVELLSGYDDLVETNRRRIALLEESARLLYREWFVKLRFPGHESVKMVDGVPEGWSRVLLSEIATVNEASINNKEVPETIRYIDIAAVETGVIRQLNEISYSDAPGRARRRVRHGDVIWSCVRPNRKSYALIWEPGEEVIASTGFAVLTPSTVPFSYLYLATTTEDFVAFLTNRATGATYPAVTAKDFAVAELLLPSTPVLDDFHARIESSLALQECLKMQNNQLAQARDALLPKLMSGQLAV